MARRKNRNKRRKQLRAARSSSASARSPSARPSPSARSPSPSPSPPTPPTVLGHRLPLPAALVAALPAFALCALVVAAFFPALGAGFVWDDAVFTKPEQVREWSGLAQIWFARDSLIQYEGHYWPLLYTTFWLEHKLWGYAPLGYHLVNLVLHSAVTVLLWRLLSRLKIPGAFIAAAIFAVHPVHTESVVWVIGRKDMLASLFFLAAALLYVRFVEERRPRRDYAIAVALFVTGLLAKSTVVTLPAALLLWHWWRHGRVTAADGMRVAPFFALGAAITFADWLHYTGNEVIAFDYTLIERAQIAAHALWFYAGKLVWPSPLMVVYPLWDIRAADALGVFVNWGYLVAAVALIATLWFARHRLGRGPLAAVLFFAVTLSPVLGFIDYGYMQFAFAADRYQYLAAAGVIVIVAAGGVWLVRRLPDALQKIAATATVVTVLLPLSALSWQQAGIYKNAGTFFSHIIALNPDARGAHHNYGDWLREQERFDDALAAYRVAEQQRPDFPNIPNNIGVVFARQGLPEKAEQQYRRALQLDPRYVIALNNLATSLTGRGQHQEALALYQRAVKINPTYAKIFAGMGVALFNLGRHEESLRSLERALSLDPSLTEARDNRDEVRRLMGKRE